MSNTDLDIPKDLKRYISIQLCLPILIENLKSAIVNYNFIGGYIIHGSCIDLDMIDSTLRFLSDRNYNIPNVKNVGDLNITLIDEKSFSSRENEKMSLDFYYLVKVPQTLVKHATNFDYHINFSSTLNLSEDISEKMLSRHVDLVKLAKENMAPFIEELIEEVPEAAKYFK